MYGIGSTDHGESSQLRPSWRLWSMVHGIPQKPLEQIQKLKSMIKMRGWTMATIADLTLGQSLESAVADMIGRSAHVIVFINEMDCECERSSPSIPQILEKVINTREIMSRLIPVISCEWLCFSGTFPQLATLTAAHIYDSNLEERLVKSIDAGKSEIMKRSAKDKTGIYIYFDIISVLYIHRLRIIALR